MIWALQGGYAHRRETNNSYSNTMAYLISILSCNHTLEPDLFILCRWLVPLLREYHCHSGGGCGSGLAYPISLNLYLRGNESRHQLTSERKIREGENLTPSNSISATRKTWRHGELHSHLHAGQGALCIGSSICRLTNGTFSHVGETWFITANQKGVNLVKHYVELEVGNLKHH